MGRRSKLKAQRGKEQGTRKEAAVVESRSDEAKRSQTGLDAVGSGREEEQVIRFTHRNRYSVIGVSVV